MHRGHLILAILISTLSCLNLVLAGSNPTIIEDREIEKENIYVQYDLHCCQQRSSQQSMNHLSVSPSVNVRNVTDVTIDSNGRTHSSYTTDSNLLAAILMTNALAVILSKF